MNAPWRSRCTSLRWRPNEHNARGAQLWRKTNNCSEYPPLFRIVATSTRVVWLCHCIRSAVVLHSAGHRLLAEREVSALVVAYLYTYTKYRRKRSLPVGVLRTADRQHRDFCPRLAGSKEVVDPNAARWHRNERRLHGHAQRRSCSGTRHR